MGAMANFEDIIHNNEATTDRITERTQGYVIINNRNGVAVKSSVENSLTQGIIKHLSGPLVSSARSAVRDLDSTNDLEFLRIATRRYELLIAPEDDFTIVVLQ